MEWIPIEEVHHIFGGIQKEIYQTTPPTHEKIMKRKLSAKRHWHQIEIKASIPGNPSVFTFTMYFFQGAESLEKLNKKWWFFTLSCLKIWTFFFFLKPTQVPVFFIGLNFELVSRCCVFQSIFTQKNNLHFLLLVVDDWLQLFPLDQQTLIFCEPYYIHPTSAFQQGIETYSFFKWTQCFSLHLTRRCMLIMGSSSFWAGPNLKELLRFQKEAIRENETLDRKWPKLGML